MNSSRVLKSLFSITSLKDLYFSKIQGNTPVGLDRINRIAFERKLDENIAIISRKVLSGIYNFSEYKQKLILKGRHSLPRLISIPTIRDKIVLKALNELLGQIFSPHLFIPSVHSVINEVKNGVAGGTYDFFLKIDIKNFYPTIDHELLEKQIKRRIKKKEVRTLISSAVKQVTKSSPNEQIKPDVRGIPQGLSISSVLANIYLSGLDKKHTKSTFYKYFRYVDDVLVLCRHQDAKNIYEDIKGDISKLKLELNEEKCLENYISSGFPYLGYFFDGSKVTVREQSVDKLVNSLIDTLAQYKYSYSQSYEVLQWRLNLRITGCVIDKEKYGWLFFFSQINDVRLLYHLDYLIQKLCERYKIDSRKIQIKKFVRTYSEIAKNFSKTNYIQNFDKTDIEEKKHILRNIFKYRMTEELNQEEIETQFRRKIFKTIKDLEKDIKPIS